MPESPLTDLPETPAGWATLWTAEFSAAKQSLKDWHERAEKIVDRYLDDRKGSTKQSRLNLFTANTQTLESLLFGKTPQVDVERKYADSADDIARVAAEILERLLNAGIEEDGESQSEAFRNALADRLRAGLGNVFVSFDAGEPKTVPGKPAEGELPEVPDTETLPDAAVDVDYVFWKDQLWSPSRT